ncbi:MAG: hypothetical protein JSW58_03730 [Candidatus Latescibacterota bacterium]|nr:MAG: hypothetical protein JSW58_03730 [Candidatus Latescibacterota bacterium]
MKHNDRYTRIPRDPDLGRVVNAAAARLVERLAAQDALGQVGLGQNRYPIDRSVERVETLVRRCTRLFAWALPHDDTPFSDLTLVDHGSPLGALSSLAKECNVGTVIYNDTDGSSCHEVQTIARGIGAEADYYISGDIHLTRHLLDTRGIDCDVFVSCDEIQRVQDPGQFFETLYDLSETIFSFALSAHLTRGNPNDDVSCSTPCLGVFDQRPTAPHPTKPSTPEGLPHPRTLRDLMTDVGFTVDVLSGFRVGGGSIIGGVLTHLQEIGELMRMLAPGAHTRHPIRKRVSPFVLRGKKPHPLQTAADRSGMLPIRHKGVIQRAIRLGTS